MQGKMSEAVRVGKAHHARTAAVARPSGPSLGGRRPACAAGSAHTQTSVARAVGVGLGLLREHRQR